MLSGACGLQEIKCKLKGICHKCCNSRNHITITKLLVSDDPAINWILDMTFGGKGETSFCFFPYLSYVFLGYVLEKCSEESLKMKKETFIKKARSYVGLLRRYGLYAALYYIRALRDSLII